METNATTDQSLNSTSTQHTEKTNKTLLKHWLGIIWKTLVTLMTKEPELRIWQSSDRWGNTLWHAYDPVTGERVTRASEIELLAWIEERYYQKYGNFR